MTTERSGLTTERVTTERVVGRAGLTTERVVGRTKGLIEGGQESLSGTQAWVSKQKGG